MCSLRIDLGGTSTRTTDTPVRDRSGRILECSGRRRSNPPTASADERRAPDGPVRAVVHLTVVDLITPGVGSRRSRQGCPLPGGTGSSPVAECRAHPRPGPDGATRAP